MRLVVASHNIMHGVFLDAMLERYIKLHHEHPVDILCLQENVPLSPVDTKVAAPGVTRTHADAISSALGPFRSLWHPEHAALATLVHSRLEVSDSFLVRLPRLSHLNWFERLYIRGGKVKQKYAQVTVVGEAEASLAIVNVHLDTAGDNQHRTSQVRALADALAERGLLRHVVVCGDTNAFTWSRGHGASIVAQIMAPLAEVANAKPTGDWGATHFFARQREPMLTHRLLTLLGRLGLDHPLPYDVICTDLKTLGSGKVTTPESDHDLVFAALALPPHTRIRPSSS